MCAACLFCRVSFERCIDRSIARLVRAIVAAAADVVLPKLRLTRIAFAVCSHATRQSSQVAFGFGDSTSAGHSTARSRVPLVAVVAVPPRHPTSTRRARSSRRHSMSAHATET